MEYNEYKAPPGKFLVNLENFTCGSTMLSVHELNVVVVDREIADQMCKEYYEKQEALKEQRIKEEEQRREEEFNNQNNEEDIATETVLNENGEYEEVAPKARSKARAVSLSEEDELQNFKKDKLNELILLGVKFDKSDVTLNKKETVNI